jgi:integrase/recombinase XerD
MTQDLRAFPAWLRTDYKPRRLCGGDDPLSPKTVRNFWVTLSAFFSWVCDEFDIPNPMKGVPAPRFEETPVEPLSKEQVEALKAAEYCREADTTDRRKFTMRRATARRDRALIGHVGDAWYQQHLRVRRLRPQARHSTRDLGLA